MQRSHILPAKRFSFETVCPGVDSKPVSYYMRWPRPINPAEAKTERFLKSLSYSEELAGFARFRASCLEENRRYVEASEAYFIRLPSFPESNHLKTYLNNVNRRQ